METEVRIGQVVYVKSGRDKDRNFIVYRIVDESYVEIVDGKVRRLAKPKKKKLKHLKLLSGCLDKLAEKIKAGKTIHDSEIRSALRNFSEEKEEADV